MLIMTLEDPKPLLDGARVKVVHSIHSLSFLALVFQSVSEFILKSFAF